MNWRMDFLDFSGPPDCAWQSTLSFVDLVLIYLWINCRKTVPQKTKCFSSTKGPVVDQMVKSCIRQFGVAFFPPSKTNTEVDSPLIDVKSTNHNWDRSVVGQNNDPHLRSNVVRITWFQVTIERQDLRGFSCPRFSRKAPTWTPEAACGLCPVLHGRSAERCVPTLRGTVCTIGGRGFPSLNPLKSPTALEKGFVPPFLPRLL